MVSVRAAEPGDAAAVAGVHVRSWQAGYRGIVPDDYLDALRPEDRMGRSTFGSSDPAVPHTMVAIEDGIILGFVTTMASPDADTEGVGEVHALYVEPGTWRSGVGRALLSAARSRLRRAGFSDAVLWVLVGNHRAERFYRLDGWQPDGHPREVEVWGVRVSETRYRTTLDP